MVFAPETGAIVRKHPAESREAIPSIQIGHYATA